MVTLLLDQGGSPRSATPVNEGKDTAASARGKLLLLRGQPGGLSASETS